MPAQERTWVQYAQLKYKASYEYVTSDQMLWSPILIGKQMYQVISRIENPRFFAIHFVGQLSLALVGNYVSFQLRNNVMVKFGTIDDYVFKTLGGEEATEADWQAFQTAILSTALPLVSFLAVRAVNNYVTASYQIWFQKKLVEHLSNRVWENPGSVALTNSPEMNAIVRNLNGDVREISASGTSLLIDWSKGAQNFFLSLNALLNFSSPVRILGVRIPDLLAISVIYTVVTQYISSLFTTRIARLNEELTVAGIKTDAIKANDYANVKPIFSAGVQDYVRVRHQQIRKALSHLSDRINLLTNAYNVWVETHGYLNMLYKNLVLGYKVFTKTIKSDSIYAAWGHFANVDNFISWSEQNQAAIKQFSAPVTRVTEFLRAEQAIARIPINLRFEGHTENRLVLRNVMLRIGQNPLRPAGADSRPKPILVTVPEFTFEMGKRYVISGKSGCGKSSLLAKINRSLHDGIDGSGTIIYPTVGGKAVKRMMLTQDDYFLEHSTLLENLLLPPNVQELTGEEKVKALQSVRGLLADPEKKAEILVRAKGLLREAKIDSEDSGNLVDRLEEEQPNWKATLSGGQRKKIKIVWAILQDPKILLLDEVLAGIDPDAIRIIQNMIVKYLPKAMTIVVDHHPDENNNQVTRADGAQEPFYQSHHRIIDKGFTEIAVQDRRLPRSRSASDIAGMRSAKFADLTAAGVGPIGGPTASSGLRRRYVTPESTEVAR
jgi:ABC-type uncharacterized transport system fused permease/ATPase subunit